MYYILLYIYIYIYIYICFKFITLLIYNINNVSIISDYSDKYYIVYFKILFICLIINAFCFYIGILV